jgi:hypothetical protein
LWRRSESFNSSKIFTQANWEFWPMVSDFLHLESEYQEINKSRFW